MRDCIGVRQLITAFNNRYCNSVCNELQCFKYENKNRLNPSWTSLKWNGGGYSAKIMLWARSWTVAEASVHKVFDYWLCTLPQIET